MAKNVSKKKMSAVRGGASVKTGPAVAVSSISAKDKALISALPSAAQQKFQGLSPDLQRVFISEVRAAQQAQADLKLSNGASQMSTVMCPW